MKIAVDRRRLGVTFEGTKAEILVWAPQAKNVRLLLTEEELYIDLSQAARGYWQGSTEDLRPGMLYRFVIDDNDPLPDPASLSQPSGVHGASRALDVSRFAWAEADWENPPLEDYIFYELHTGTFSAEGDFDGIEKKLKHLTNLGITAVEIMPVAQFPGDRNWGYDGVFPFAVQSSYGGAEGLQKLVDACHREGLAVVLDVVYNHLGPEGNYLTQYGPYFTDKYRTPWGAAVNFDDAGSDEVRSYFIENVLMWFRDFHIDALRLDAVHAIKDFSPKHLLREIKEHVNALMQLTGKRHYLIIECDLNDTRFISEKKGYGMDAQWIDEFHHALRVTCGNERKGYYADFEGLPHLAKAYKDAYVYDGIYSHHRQRTFGTKALSHPGKQFIVFSQNHDQVGNRMLGERASQLAGIELAKVKAAAVLMAPYLPLLFMGEEWADTHPFLYFADHSDEQLIEAVKEGRRSEFAAFHSEGTPPDPFAVETFEQSKLQWNLLRQHRHRSIYAYYIALIALRKAEPALRTPDRKNLKLHSDTDKNILILQRWSGENHICCVMNFSKSVRQEALPATAGLWEKVLDSSDVTWAGPGAHSDGKPGVATLNPESVIIYKSKDDV